MYTVIISKGIVRRNYDGKIIAPCQSAEDPDFVAYNKWIEEGNEPIIVEIETQEE